MSAGEDGSPPLSETKRYNGVVAKVNRKKYHHKDGNCGERINCELTRDDAGEQEPLIFAALEQSLPAAKVDMKVSFNVRPWKKAGLWDYEAVNVTMLGHAPKKAEITVPQLKAKCKELGISGYSKLKKAELIKKLEDASNAVPKTAPRITHWVDLESPSEWTGGAKDPPGNPFNSTKQWATTWYHGGKLPNKKGGWQSARPSWGETVSKKIGIPFDLLKGHWEKSAQYFLRDYEDRGGEIIEEGATFEGIFIEAGVGFDGFDGLAWCEKFDSPIYVRHDDSWEKGSIVGGNKVSFGVKIGFDEKLGHQFKATTWKSKIGRSRTPIAFAVSLDDIENNKSKKIEVIEHLEKTGLALLVAVSGARSKGNVSALLQKIGAGFDGYHCTELSPKELVKNKYKLIAEQVICCLAIHDGEELNKVQTESCQLGMCRIAYEQQVANRSENEWTILGDETGSGREWMEEEAYRRTRMMWVAVPPHVDLAVCHPKYHMSDVELYGDETTRMWNELASREDVLCYVFSWEQGVHPSSRKNRPGMPSAKAVLEMTRLTLPLVLEHIVSIAEEDIKIRILSETIGNSDMDLPPGATALDLTMQEMENYYELRGHRLEISRPLVIAKNPLDHAWLGYPDLIGHIHDETADEANREGMTRSLEKTISKPFRGDTLNLRITGLVKDSAYPLEFLKSLAGIPAEDMRDYVEPFLTETTHEALSKLEAGEWQDLLEHLLATSPGNTRSSKYIYRMMDITEASALQVRDVEKYNFLRAMLGISNHMGDVRQARECRQLIDKLGGKFEVPKGELDKLRTLEEGTGNNVFDFEHIDRGLDVLQSFSASKMPENTAHHLGAQALARALRGRDEDLDEASRIESKLRVRAKNSESDDDILRRYVYWAELQMDKMRQENDQKALEAAHEALSVDPVGGLMRAVGGSRKWEWCFRDPYFVAAYLKCCALMKRTGAEFTESAVFVNRILGEDHPSQRIAYWCAVWANEIGLEGNQVSEECLSHIVKMSESSYFGKDAAGVILACELRDLESRGLIEFDSQEFLDRVLNESHEKTREWVEAHRPDEEDWLRPLNFNYR